MRKCFVLIILSTLMMLSGWAFADTEGHKFPGKGDRAKWEEASPLFNQGVILFNSGNFAGAIAKYKAAIAVYPFDHEYFNNLGLAYKKNGELNPAEEALRHAIELNGSSWDSWSNLGSVLKRLGKTDEALTAYQKALALNPPAKSRTLLNQNVTALHAARARAEGGTTTIQHGAR